MALVLPVDVVETFFGMWTGTITYDVAEPDVDEDDQLDPAAVADEPAVTAAYDPVRGEQHLVYRGVLVERGRSAWSRAYPEPQDGRPATPNCSTSVVRHRPGNSSTLYLLAPVGFLATADYDGVLHPGRRAPTRNPRRCSPRDGTAGRGVPAVRARPAHRPGRAGHRGRRVPRRADLVTALVTEPALVADRPSDDAAAGVPGGRRPRA